ncbi:MAG: hypothetical protein WBS19_08530 [Candidatus Korobacteraceae bacterium]
MPTTNVTITITGSSGSYTPTNSPTEPAGGYSPPISVIFTNSTTGSITVYYGVTATSFQSVTIAAGQSSVAIPSTVAMEFNVVPATANPSTWAHVIHVGSSVP